MLLIRHAKCAKSFQPPQLTEDHGIIGATVLHLGNANLFSQKTTPADE
jgi:hypothetical protein